MDRPLAIIVDRDGTLAACHNGPKKNTAQKGSKEDNANWEAFNAALVFDAPIPRIVALLKAIRPGVTILVVSGRAEGNHPGDRHRRFRLMDWLYKHQIPYDALYMREGGDKRLDSVVKESILLRDILPFYRPVVAIDDRETICQVWEKYDIMVIRVTNDSTRLPPIAFQMD